MIGYIRNNKKPTTGLEIIEDFPPDRRSRVCLKLRQFAIVIDRAFGLTLYHYAGGIVESDRLFGIWLQPLK